MSTRQKDARGAEYEVKFFDQDGVELDPYRMMDGDPLLDPRLYKTTHTPVLTNQYSGNNWYVASQGTMQRFNEPVTAVEYKDGGICQTCHIVGVPFYVTDGKEYCGACNEYFDTYAFVRSSAKKSEHIRHQMKTTEQMFQKASRNGDFIRAQNYKLELQRLDIDYQQARDYEDQLAKIQREAPENRYKALQSQIMVTQKLYQDSLTKNETVLADHLKRRMSEMVRELEKLSLYGN